MVLQANWGNFMALVFTLVVVCIPFLVGWYRKRKESNFMQLIAQKLGFVYVERGDVTRTQAQGLSGGEIFDVISGVHNSIAVAAFAYRVLTGGRQKYWSYMTVLETPLPGEFPDIVLRPNAFSVDMAANVAVSRNTFLGSYEKTLLEGDFGKYFVLYVARGAQVEAREIFTPDVMAEMIDQYQSYGIEFSKQTLYLYPMKLITNEQSFMQSLDLLERLVQSLKPALSTMSNFPTTN